MVLLEEEYSEKCLVPTVMFSDVTSILTYLGSPLGAYHLRSLEEKANENWRVEFACHATPPYIRKGNLTVIVRNAPTGQPPRKSDSSRHPVKLPKESTGLSRGEPCIPFGAPEEDRMSIAVSEEGLTPDEAEESPLRRLLSRRPTLNWRPCSSGRPRASGWLCASRLPPSPRGGMFGSWDPDTTQITRVRPLFLSSRRSMKSSLGRGKCLTAPVHVRVLPSSLPSRTGQLGGTRMFPRWSVQLQCTCACKMPPPGRIVHVSRPKPVHQAQALKQLHEGRPDKGVMQELRTVTDFALRATKVTARSLGQVMATMVVQERHLWLNLAQMADADKVRFLDAPISQAGLFSDTVEDFTQQFSAVQKQTEAIKHILPQRESTKPPVAKSSSAHRRGHPPVASTPAPPPPPKESTAPQRGRRAGRGRDCSAGDFNICAPAPGAGILAAAADLRVSSTHPFTKRANFSISGSFSPDSSSDPTLRWDATPPMLSHLPLPWLPHRRCISPSIDPTSTQVGGVAIAAQPVTLVDPDDASVLRAEIAFFLAKDAIEPVPPAEMKLGFYSPYFIVPKKNGGLRPILDLRVLNQSLCKMPFKMLTPKRIISCIRHQDWFAAIDLKDAYFHVSILPRYRPFLRFAFEGRAYQYKVVPFGLALSPRVFTKLVEGALAPQWEQGIRILNYLDDWLITAHSRDLLCEHRDLVLQHLSLLGLQVNWEKSKLSPVQSTSFLGMELDSVSMMARLTEERAQSVLSCLNLFKHSTAVPLKIFQRLLGHMAAAAAVTPLCLLHMRPLQHWLHGWIPRWAWHRGTFRPMVRPGIPTGGGAPWAGPEACDCQHRCSGIWEDGSVSACCAIPFGSVRLPLWFPVPAGSN
ncbi:Transposon Ty3-G Gag-Pol polyprotein [Labeo rohita]|uniref:ribonuclease H n=1 Tax=Labeo rohita TaxID=84645 RepID=A0ABQ8M1B6_LABRO|nr:Transposon Ty3-G Gag-Pol polyprotein [Labeo rohita]